MSRPTRQSSKQANDINRAVERECRLPGCNAALIHTKQKRVWKACERCRMKKTKCNGESPCKRCKEDGSVCVTRHRKRIEPKQFPEGYAEILESTHWTMTATILKLYNMVRNNKTWDLEEPELNIRDQPVVHDIAFKLGCFDPFSNLSVALRGGNEDFTLSKMQIQKQGSMMDDENAESKKRSDQPPSNMPGVVEERAGGAGSGNTPSAPDYSQTLWTEQQWKIESVQAIMHPRIMTNLMPPSHLPHLTDDDRNFFVACTTRAPSRADTSIQSATCKEDEAQTPIFHREFLLPPWSSTDEFARDSDSIAKRIAKDTRNLTKSSSVEAAQFQNLT